MAFKRTKRWFRLWRIAFVMSKEGVDNIAFSSPMLRPFKFVTWINPFWFSYHKKTRGERIRLTLEKLGPIFVKFGQILSTRRDILPPDIIDELSKLQDNVPPFSAEKAIKIIEKSLKKPIKDVFDNFQETALASASIAQVHAAELKGDSKNKEKIIIKVLRPNVKKIMTQDLEILEIMAKSAERFNKLAKKIRLLALVQEAKHHMLNELDLMREAANACQLKRNFKNNKLLYIPKIYWPHCTENIMIMEKINGVPIYNSNELLARNTDMKILAERGIEIFYTQVFRDCFFHADMHPGNLFVNTKNPKKPTYIAVDFGVMGTLNSDDQYYLAANFLAFFKRDYHEVAKLHVDSGWVARGTSIEDFESAIRTVCEPIFERPIKDISFGQTLLRLFQIAQKFEMRIQPQLLLLQKTLFNIEGLARQLFPELDLWKIARPVLEDWMKKQIGFKSLWHRTKKHYPYMSANFPDVPIMLYEIIKHTKGQQIETLAIQNQSKKDIGTKHRKSNLASKLFYGLGSIIIIVAGALSINYNAIISAEQWLIIRPSVISVIGIAVLALGWYVKPKI